MNYYSPSHSMSNPHVKAYIWPQQKLKINHYTPSASYLIPDPNHLKTHGDWNVSGQAFEQHSQEGAVGLDLCEFILSTFCLFLQRKTVVSLYRLYAFNVGYDDGLIYFRFLPF